MFSSFNGFSSNWVIKRWCAHPPYHTILHHHTLIYNSQFRCGLVIITIIKRISHPAAARCVLCGPPGAPQHISRSSKLKTGRSEGYLRVGAPRGSTKIAATEYHQTRCGMMRCPMMSDVCVYVCVVCAACMFVFWPGLCCRWL